jgi:hypothetical protein
MKGIDKIERRLFNLIAKKDPEVFVCFSDKHHNNLERCTECGLKFDIYRLIRVSVGVFVCPFCNRGRGNV